MVPLISSLCYGPSGMCQLPRTWWKVILRAKGLLDEEYPDFSGGLDRQVLERLGLDQEETLAYLRTNLPGYLQFEDWVLRKKGGRIDPAVVKDWSDTLAGRKHKNPAKMDETYGDIGWDKSKVHVDSAIVLNATQDWQLFYKRDLSSDFACFGGQVVPLVATIDYGALGVCQLPRTWYKILMRAKNRLHTDYPDMTKGGLDPRALLAVNIKPDDAVALIRSKLPTYVQFEEWILDKNAGRIDPGPVNEWNTFVRTRTHNEKKQTEIRALVGRESDTSLTSGAVLNHIEDWHYAHQLLMRHT